MNNSRVFALVILSLALCNNLHPTYPKSNHQERRTAQRRALGLTWQQHHNQTTEASTSPVKFPKQQTDTPQPPSYNEAIKETMVQWEMYAPLALVVYGGLTALTHCVVGLTGSQTLHSEEGHHDRTTALLSTGIFVLVGTTKFTYDVLNNYKSQKSGQNKIN